MKTETEKTATKVFNGLIFLSIHAPAQQKEVLNLVSERLRNEGFASIAALVETAASTIAPWEGK